jgi:hypothetical protein
MRQPHQQRSFAAGVVLVVGSPGGREHQRDDIAGQVRVAVTADLDLPSSAILNRSHTAESDKLMGTHVLERRQAVETPGAIPAGSEPASADAVRPSSAMDDSAGAAGRSPGTNITRSQSRSATRSACGRR